MSNQLLSWNTVFQQAVATTKRWGIFALGFVSLLLSASLVVAVPSSEPSFPPSEADAFETTVEEVVANNGEARVIILLQDVEISQANASKNNTPAAKRKNIKQVQENFMLGLKEKVQDGLANGKVAIGAAAADPDGQVKTMFTEFPMVAMTIDNFLLEAVKGLPMVASIELDHAVAPTLSGSIPLIGADDAWQNGYTGGCQAVAVLDTGVDKAHPDLNGKVIAEACFSMNTGSTTSLCPNALNNEIGPDTASFHCGVDGRCVHGTHVAGIVAANGNVEGVAKGANIVAVQVFHKNKAGELKAWFSDIIQALQHVLQLHQNGQAIAAVNMSLGGGQFFGACDASFTALTTAIVALRAAGIATVVASGNDGFTSALGAPACISSAISVGATSKSDVVASFSNSASFLDLLAPGVSINSTIPGGNHAFFNGTSMATPHVAGAWAVLKAAKPAATVNDILNALQTTGAAITDWRNGITKPRIQVDAALAALGPDVRNLLYGVHDEGLNNSQFFTIDPNNSFQVAALGAGCPGCDIEALDMHPQTCELYASAGDDTKKPGHLYLVSKNGGLTDLGPTGFQEVDALSFNPDTGVLWGWAQDAGLLRFDNLPSATATLVAPISNWEVEDLTWNMAGTTLYGVKNLHGNHDPDSHGPLDSELGVELLAYDGTLNSVCQSLVNSMEIEALDTLPDDTLIFGYHNRNDLNLGVLDVNNCSVPVQESISTPYNDVEGIAWPSSQ